MEYRLWIYHRLKKKQKTNKNNIASCYLYSSNGLYYFIGVIVNIISYYLHTPFRIILDFKLLKKILQ